MSKRSSKAMNMPGMTMSPRPSMAKLSAARPFSSRSWGNTTAEQNARQSKNKLWALFIHTCIYATNPQPRWVQEMSLRLMGASKDLATETMTLVPNTYKIRYTKRYKQLVSELCLVHPYAALNTDSDDHNTILAYKFSIIQRGKENSPRIYHRWTVHPAKCSQCWHDSTGGTPHHL